MLDVVEGDVRGEDYLVDVDLFDVLRDRDRVVVRVDGALAERPEVFTLKTLW